MNDLEEQLADELVAVVEHLGPPNIDIAALKVAAMRTHRRQRGLVGISAVAAAAVLGVGLAVVLPTGGTRDTPTLTPSTAHDAADLGRALELPWWGSDGESADPRVGLLRIDGATIPVDDVSALVHRGDVTLVEQTTGLWSVVDGDALVPLTGGQPVAAPVTDNAGAIAYVVANSDGTYNLVREQDHHVVTKALTTSETPAVVGLDGDRVVLSFDDELWVWSLADSAPSPVTGLPRRFAPSDVRPRAGGVAIQADNTVIEGVLRGTRFHAVWEAAIRADGIWSENGQTYAAASDGEVEFTDQTGTTAISLGEAHLRVVGWESADEFVVVQWLDADRAVTGLWRCSTEAERCAPIDDPMGRVLLPGLPDA